MLILVSNRAESASAEPNRKTRLDACPWQPPYPTILHLMLSHLLRGPCSLPSRVVFCGPCKGCRCFDGSAIIPGRPRSLEYLSYPTSTSSNVRRSCCGSLLQPLSRCTPASVKIELMTLFWMFPFAHVAYLIVLTKQGHAFNFSYPTTDSHTLHVEPGGAAQSFENPKESSLMPAIQAQLIRRSVGTVTQMSSILMEHRPVLSTGLGTVQICGYQRGDLVAILPCQGEGGLILKWTRDHGIVVFIRVRLPWFNRAVAHRQTAILFDTSSSFLEVFVGVNRYCNHCQYEPPH